MSGSEANAMIPCKIIGDANDRDGPDERLNRDDDV